MAGHHENGATKRASETFGRKLLESQILHEKAKKIREPFIGLACPVCGKILTEENMWFSPSKKPACCEAHAKELI